MAAMRAAAVVLLVAATDAGAIRATSAAEFGFTEPNLQTVGDSETIPLGVVTALVHDSRGLLWIGTQQGLMRFDGYRYRRFSHDAADAGSLAGDFVTSIFAGADGRIWVGTNSSGLSVFDPASERFVHFGHDAQNPASINPGASIRALAGSAAGDVWIGTDQGVDLLARGASEFRHYRHLPSDPSSLASDQVRSLLVDSRGVLWVGTKSGLQRLRQDGGGFERVASAAEDASSLAGESITALFEAADGKLWIGTPKEGVAWLDPATLQLHRLAVDPSRSDRLSHRRIVAFAQAERGQIWVGTFGGGINILDAADGRVLQQLRHDAANPGSLALDSVGAMAVDRSGALWVGTWGAGLQRHNQRNQAFRVMRHSPTRAVGLSHADVHSVLAAANGQLLVGTGGNGIDIVDRRRGRVGGYRPAPGRPGGLADGLINGMVQTRDGALWVGTLQAGVQRLAAGSAAWQGYAVAQGLPSTQVRKVFVDRRGELWVGTDSGLAHWQAGRQRFETYAGPDGSPMRSWVVSLSDDAEGRLWVATLAGLWVLEPGAKVLQAIHRERERRASLSSEAVRGLLNDSEGRLWVATAEGLDRLQRWDGKRADFEHISEMLGRPGFNFGYNLYEDKLGRIWTPSYVLDPKRMRLHALSKADGLEVGTVWVGSHGATRDGLFLFGGTQGLAIVEPEKFQPWDYQPPVVVTELKINGQSVPAGALGAELSLSPEQHNFTVEFAALDFSAPQKNRYRYRLQGYDQDWIETDAANRIAAYGKLAPGSYTLEVRGSNRLGEWSPHELSIAVRVLPAWHQTPAFRLFALASLLAAVYALVLARTSVLRRRQRVLEREVAERTADLVEKNKQLEILSVSDRLTGLYNRAHLDRVLEDELARRDRGSGLLSVILLDIDHFKEVNDMHGHQVGDQVLVAVAKLLTEHTREIDVLGRWGGEEFLVVCRETALEGAVVLAEKLRASMAECAFPVVGHKTGSFGVASLRTEERGDALIARADAALYRAKRKGRNRVEADE